MKYRNHQFAPISNQSMNKINMEQCEYNATLTRISTC